MSTDIRERFRSDEEQKRAKEEADRWLLYDLSVERRKEVDAYLNELYQYKLKAGDPEAMPGDKKTPYYRGGKTMDWIRRKIDVVGVMSLEDLEKSKYFDKVANGIPSAFDTEMAASMLAEIELKRRAGALETAFDIGTDMPKFMLQFASGAGAGRAMAAKAGAKLFPRAAMGAKASTTANRLGAVGSGATQLTTQVAISPNLAIGKAAQEASHKMFIDDEGKVYFEQGDEDVFKHLPKGYADAYVEFFTEHSGALGGKVLDKMGVSKKIKESVVGLAVAKMAKKLGISKTKAARRVQQTLFSAGFNGPLTEMGEEILGEMIRGATGLEADYGTVQYLLSNDPELRAMAMKNLHAQAIAFGTIGAGAATTSIGLTAYERKKIKEKIDKVRPVIQQLRTASERDSEALLAPDQVQQFVQNEPNKAAELRAIVRDPDTNAISRKEWRHAGMKDVFMSGQQRMQFAKAVSQEYERQYGAAPPPAEQQEQAPAPEQQQQAGTAPAADQQEQAPPPPQPEVRTEPAPEGTPDSLDELARDARLLDNLFSADLTPQQYAQRQSRTEHLIQLAEQKTDVTGKKKVSPEVLQANRQADAAINELKHRSAEYQQQLAEMQQEEAQEQPPQPEQQSAPPISFTEIPAEQEQAPPVPEQQQQEQAPPPLPERQQATPPPLPKREPAKPPEPPEAKTIPAAKFDPAESLKRYNELWSEKATLAEAPTGKYARRINAAAERLGFKVVYYENSDHSDGFYDRVAQQKVVFLRKPKTLADHKENLFVTLAHEIAHGLNLDVTGKDLFTPEQLQQAWQEYAEALGPETAAKFEKEQPENMTKEAVAWMIGETFRKPEAFRKLAGENPKLLERIVEKLREILGMPELSEQDKKIIQRFLDTAEAAKPKPVEQAKPKYKRVTQPVDAPSLQKEISQLKKTISDLDAELGRVAAVEHRKNATRKIAEQKRKISELNKAIELETDKLDEFTRRLQADGIERALEADTFFDEASREQALKELHHLLGNHDQAKIHAHNVSSAAAREAAKLPLTAQEKHLVENQAVANFQWSSTTTPGMERYVKFYAQKAYEARKEWATEALKNLDVDESVKDEIQKQIDAVPESAAWEAEVRTIMARGEQIRADQAPLKQREKDKEQAIIEHNKKAASNKEAIQTRQQQRTKQLSDVILKRASEAGQSRTAVKDHRKLLYKDGERKLPAELLKLNDEWAIATFKRTTLDAYGVEGDAESRIISLKVEGDSNSIAAFGNLATAKRFIGLLDLMGVDLRGTTDKSGITSGFTRELRNKVKAATTAIDNNSIDYLDQADRQKLIDELAIKPTDIKATLLLDSLDLNKNSDAFRVLRELAEAFPEFSLDPVFVVDSNGRLTWRNHNWYTFEPTFFNLHDGLVKPGETVGVNLEDFGFKRLTTMDEVRRKILEQRGYKTTKRKEGFGLKLEDKPGPAPYSVVKGKVTGPRRKTVREIQDLLDHIRKPKKHEDQAIVESMPVVAPGVQKDDLALMPQREDRAGNLEEGDLIAGEGREHDRTPVEIVIDDGASVKTLHGAAAPELVRFLRAMGADFKVEFMDRMVRARVRIDKRDRALVILNEKLGSDANQLARTLAHEIGHIDLYLPERTDKYKTIVSALKAIRKDTSKLIAPAPGMPGPWTAEEEAEIRRQIYEEFTTHDPVLTRVPIYRSLASIGVSHEHLIDYFNDVATPNLTEEQQWYVKRLTSNQRKQLMAAAFKGRLPEQIRQIMFAVPGFQAQASQRKVKPAPGLVQHEFEQRLANLIEQRQLIEEHILHQELVNLSEFWRPYDNTNDALRKERETVPELYGDFVSAMLTSPATAQHHAPTMVQLWLNYVSRNPQTQVQYQYLQDVLAGGSMDIAEERQRESLQAYEEGNETVTTKMEQQLGKKQNIFEFMRQAYLRGRMNVVDQYWGSKARAKKANDMMAYATIDEMYSIDNEIRLFLKRIQDGVVDPLTRVMGDAALENLGQYLQHRRIVGGGRMKTVHTPDGEQSVMDYELLNPDGFTSVESSEQLQWMREQLGPEQWRVLQRAADTFYGEVYAISKRATEVGMYSRKAFYDVIADHWDTYATFWTLKHLDDNLGWRLEVQEGTLERIMNPFEATIWKMTQLIRATEKNRGNQAIFRVMSSSFQDEIKVKEPGKPVGKDNGELRVWFDGKMHTYEVPIEVAFLSSPSFSTANFKRLADTLNSWQYSIFHPLYVTLSPGFLARNIKRDLSRTHKLLGSKYQIGWWELVGRLLTELNFWAEDSAWTRIFKDKWSPVYLEMMKAKAIAEGFTKTKSIIDREGALERRGLVAKDISPYRRMAMRHGVLPAHEEALEGKEGWWAGSRRAYWKVHDWFAKVAEVQENASKTAAWKALEARGVGVPERALAVRKLAGTPDFKQRGTSTHWINLVYLYGKVTVNSLESELSIATDKQTRSRYWIRQLLWTIIPAAMSNAFCKLQPEWCKAIPSYFWDNSTVIPLPIVFPTEEGKWTQGFFTIPLDDNSQIIRSVTRNGIDFAAEGFGWWDTPRASATEAFNNAMKDTAGMALSLAPPWKTALKYAEMITGKRPYDDYFGSYIIPKDSWDAGMITRHQKFAGWVWSQSGVLEDLSTLVGSAGTAAGLPELFGQVFDDRKEKPWEKLIRGVPGLNKYLRFSARGHEEEFYAKQAEEQQFAAQMRSKLPKLARGIASDYLKFRKKANAGTATRQEQALINHYQPFYATYRQYTVAITEAELGGRHDAAKRMRQELLRIAQDTRDSRPTRRR